MGGIEVQQVAMGFTKLSVICLTTNISMDLLYFLPNATNIYAFFLIWPTG